MEYIYIGQGVYVVAVWLSGGDTDSGHVVVKLLLSNVGVKLDVDKNLVQRSVAVSCQCHGL